MARHSWDSYAVCAAREMGHQFRTRYVGQPDPLGYEARSLAGKLIEEGLVGSSQSLKTPRQFAAEYFTGAGLKARRAMRGLNDVERTVLEWHFLPRGVPVPQRARAIGWRPSTYYRHLNRAMHRFALALETLPERAA
jgi:hypothetical protein